MHKQQAKYSFSYSNTLNFYFIENSKQQVYYNITHKFVANIT